MARTVRSAGILFSRLRRIASASSSRSAPETAASSSSRAKVRRKSVPQEEAEMPGQPSINASLDELRNQMARGGQHGAAPGSAGNIMPGANMQPARTSSGGTTAGTAANPSRVGNPPISSGSYQPIAGSPGPSAPPTAESVRTHSLALGGLKHMVAAGHLHPTHAAKMEQASRAHIAAYKGAGAAKAPPAPRRFGALGGAAPASMKTGQDGDGGW
jgi:hypothetical protein